MWLTFPSISMIEEVRQKLVSEKVMKPIFWKANKSWMTMIYSLRKFVKIKEDPGIQATNS